MPGFPVYHQLLELSQTHVHRVSDAIQPSHPLSSPSPPAFNLSQHQGLSSESVLRFRWPKYWSFSFSISPSNEYSGLISLRIDWIDLLDVQGTLKSLLQHHTSKGSILRRSTPVLLPGKSHGQRSLVGCSPWGSEESDTTERLHFHFSLSCIREGNGSPLQCSCLENPRDGRAWWAAIYGVARSWTLLKRLSSSSSNFLYSPALTSIHDYWKSNSFARWTFVSKVMSLLFNMLSRLVIAFLLRSKCLLISWLQSPSTVILEPPKIKSATVSLSICHEVMGLNAMICFLNVEL